MLAVNGKPFKQPGYLFPQGSRCFARLVSVSTEFVAKDRIGSANRPFDTQETLIQDR